MNGAAPLLPNDRTSVLHAKYTLSACALTGVWELKCHSKVSIIFLRFICIILVVKLSVSSDVVIADVCHGTSSLVTCVKC